MTKKAKNTNQGVTAQENEKSVMGVVRKFDPVGRIVIPVEMRSALGLYNGVSAEMHMENDAIIIKKCGESCVFCGTYANLTDYLNKKVCNDCLRVLKLL